ERGRDDLAIAPPAEHAEQRGLDVAFALGLVRQIDPGSLRELRLARLHGATASRCATVFIRCTVAQPGSYSISVIPARAAPRAQPAQARHDAVAHEHDRLLLMRLLKTCQPGSDARGHGGHGLAAHGLEEVRRRAPLGPGLGIARANLVAGQPLPGPEAHLAEG